MYDFVSLKKMAKIPQEEEEYRQEEEEEFQVLCPPISLKNLKTLWDRLWVPLSSTCSLEPTKTNQPTLPITQTRKISKWHTKLD